MNEDLLRFKKDQKYIVFDFETCNLNLASLNNKPWQLAFIIAEGNRVLEKHDYYIEWEDLNISAEAAKITGFSRSRYDKQKKNAKEVLSHFEKYLYDDEYINVGHNIFGFDIYIHNIFRKNLGLRSDYSFIKRSIDTLSLAKSIEKNIEYRKNEHFSKEVFAKELKKLVALEETRPRKERCWRFPPLEECRNHFEEKYGIKITEPG